MGNRTAEEISEYLSKHGYAFGRSTSTDGAAASTSPEMEADQSSAI